MGLKSWLLSKRVGHPTTPDLYQYHSGEIPTPGASIFAFETRQSLPIIRFIGTGTPPDHQFRVTPGPQIFQGLNLPVEPMQGFPYEGIVFQGLSANPNDPSQPVE